MFLNTQYAEDIVTLYNRKYTDDIPKYWSVSTGESIKAFLNSSLRIAASTDPLDNAQNAKADSNGGKVTIPLTLSTFNIMTKKTKGLKLKVSQFASIYKKGGITAWSSLKSGLSGNIQPYARSDTAGATKVISQWVIKSGISWATPASTTPWSNYDNIFKSNIKYVSGNLGLASAVFKNSNGIGYIQTGIGAAAGLNEIAIQNPAGVYVYPSKSDPSQSIPRTLPPSDGNWAGVDLLNVKGGGTYPIVSFIYLFTKKQGSGRIRKLLTFTQSSVIQNLVNTRYSNSFQRLPAAITRKNTRAITLIKGK